MNPNTPAPSNIQKELAGAANVPLKFSPADPAVAEAVKQFMGEKTAELTPEAQAAQEQSETQSPKVSLPPNQEFDNGDPVGNYITEALTSLDKTEITGTDRELFLKAVLTDTPIRMTVSLYNGKFALEARSRSTFEQKRVFDVLKLDQKEKLIEDGDLAAIATRMHYYLAALMVERINGVLVSELTLAPGKPLEEDAAKLRAAADKLFETMTSLRWTSILNALRIFEHKCARMNSEAANGDFWNPQG